MTRFVSRVEDAIAATALAVGADGVHDEPRGAGAVEAALATRHDDARGESLQVELERARARLVEVVEVEHQASFGAGVPMVTPVDANTKGFVSPMSPPT